MTRRSHNALFYFRCVRCANGRDACESPRVLKTCSDGPWHSNQRITRLSYRHSFHLTKLFVLCPVCAIMYILYPGAHQKRTKEWATSQNNSRRRDKSLTQKSCGASSIKRFIIHNPTSEWRWACGRFVCGSSRALHERRQMTPLFVIYTERRAEERLVSMGQR